MTPTWKYLFPKKQVTQPTQTSQRDSPFWKKIGKGMTRNPKHTHWCLGGGSRNSRKHTKHWNQKIKPHRKQWRKNKKVMMKGAPNLYNFKQKKQRPGDSIRDLTVSPSWRSRLQPLSSGHVFTHHPKKVTFSQNCQGEFDLHRTTQAAWPSPDLQLVEELDCFSPQATCQGWTSKTCSLQGGPQKPINKCATVEKPEVPYLNHESYWLFNRDLYNYNITG